MKFHYLIILLAVALLSSCKDNQTTKKSEVKVENLAPKFQNKGHECVYEMVQKVGNYQDFLDKKDVVYTYTYATPDGKKDVSIEKYIFDGERSIGKYEQHERTLPQLEGTIEQGYNGTDFWFRHQSEYLEEEEFLKKTKFNRKTNFYWFAMFQKLLDPGLNYEYVKEDTLDGKKYDIVKVSFNSEDNKPTDIYQVYINQETKLIDQFLFTVADFNVMEKPLLMRVDYEKVDGILIPNKRKYKKSTWNAEVSDAPWINVSWSDIKFDNGLTKSDFDKKNN